MHESPTTSPSATIELPSLEELSSHFPQYEVQSLLGRGGMGAVYRARHRKLDRVEAIKILLPDLEGDPEFAERFTQEARSLARLNHPGIVGILDFGEVDGLFYLVMEHVEGASLRELQAQGALSARDALAFVPQICDALQYAHDAGLVHRDIKPENILVDQDGRVRVVDFGLAKRLDEGRDSFPLTGSHRAVGTPHYMAPEQVGARGDVDHRADIYSLGVVIYEMLTGELPLGRFTPPSESDPANAPFDKVIMRSLASKPESRYQHAREVKEDLAEPGSSAGQQPRGRAGSHATASAARPGETRGGEPARKTLGHWARRVPWNSWLMFSLLALAIPFHAINQFFHASSTTIMLSVVRGVVFLGIAGLLAGARTARGLGVRMPLPLTLLLATLGFAIPFWLTVKAVSQDGEPDVIVAMALFVFGLWSLVELSEMAWQKARRRKPRRGAKRRSRRGRRSSKA